MSKKVIGFLDGYQEDDYSFKYLNNPTPLNAVFMVQTAETDNEKIIRKVKDLIKGTDFGKVLYFAVNVE